MYTLYIFIIMINLWKNVKSSELEFKKGDYRSCYANPIQFCYMWNFRIVNFFLLALFNFAKSDIHTFFLLCIAKKKKKYEWIRRTWIDKFMGMEIYLLIKIANIILNWIGRHKCYFTSISYSATAAVWST